MLSITVDTLVDVVDANDGRTSLREAIADAPAYGSAVEFHSSLQGGTIELNSQLNISQTITITGPGADKLTIDARQTGRVFHIFSGVGMATISGLKITGGLQGPGGGGVLNQGSLKLLNVVVSGNQSYIHGGGVFSDGPYLEINGSSIENNRASWGGGVAGDLAGNEWIYIVNSTIADNVADDPNSSNGQGGGVRVSVSSTSTISNLEIHNSTISGNRSESQGGGVHLAGLTRANIRNVTIVNNRADMHSGGIFNEAPPALMRNSVLAGNTSGDAARADGSGSLSGQFNVTSRYNFVGADHSSFQLLAANSNILGPAADPLDPKVSPLTHVGGLTRVHVPLPGSPIIDHGADGDAGGLTGDQRGSGRFIEDNTAPNAPGNTSDIGPVELEARLAVGDFNGDGREDELRYSPALKSLLVAEKAATGAGWEVSGWGSLALATNPSPTSTNGIIVGDFNGDGRDDVMTLNSDYSWLIGISDGTLFHVTELKNGSGPFGAGWQYVYVGDFDGDGDEEVIGKVNGGTNWTLVEYSGVTGVSRAAMVGLSGFVPGTQVFVQDVNRDGTDDFITRANGSSPWMVNLSQGNATGTLQFTTTPDLNTWIAYGYDNAKATLNADKAMAKVIEEFAWVYNNVELELYPGFMKGVEATRQTKAGNDWDQAGLLEARLQALPFMAASDVQIASANVRVNVAELQKWLGMTTPTAVYRAISATMDSNVKAYDSSNGQLTEPTTLAAESTFNSSVATIEFKHAWVRASVPLASGMQSIDLDPSWKFKERQDGVPLPTEVNLDGGNHATAGQFDEFDFLALDPRTDHRLPLEFFEDQAMEWLRANQPGKSLADVPRSEIIVTRHFAQIPAGLGTGVAVVDRNSSTTYDTGDIDQYSSLATIADPANAASDALTHRVVITMKSGTTVRWSQELSVPIRSLDSIVVSFTSTAQGVTDPDANLAYSSTNGPFFSRLIVNGEVLASSGYAFYSSIEKAKIEILHLAPESLTEVVASGTPNAAGPSKNDRLFKYDEKPGQVIAIGLEANQYSRDSIADKQGKLLVASATAHSENDLRKHIDDLTALTAAKYWYDFNRHNKTIEGLTQTIGGQQWVGSGLVKGDSVLLVDPAGHSSEAGFIRYLPYGMAPVDFGVDLPNINHVTLNTSRGLLDREAWQLVGYNSSALEHNVVEEVIGAPSISTMKGLQQAFQRTLGLNGNDVLITTDVVLEFTSKVVNNVRVITHVGNWYSNGTTGVQAASPTNVNVTTANLHNYLTSTTAPLGQLRSHLGATTLATDVEAILSAPVADGDLRILVPFGQTKLNEWVGGAYVVEKSSSMQFLIVADSSANGGYSGGVTLAPPKELQKGNFLNASWAGDPVNVANGNMFRDETDFVYPNPGVPLTFSRHYDSQSLEDFGLGVGWTYSFGDVLYTETVEGAVNRVWLDSTGRRHYFKPDGSGGYLVPASLQGQVTFIANQNVGAVDFIFKNSDGLEYHFERVTYNRSTKALVGRLNRILDSNGDGVVVKYETTSDHKLLYVHDVHDANATPVRRIGFTYGPGGTAYQFDTVTRYDVNGVVQTWDYKYVGVGYVENQGSNFRLSYVDYPAIAAVDVSGIESSVRPRVEYIHRDVTWDSAMGMIEKIIETDGSWHTYEYFKNGRVFRVKQGEFGVAVDDPKVDVQTFEYNIYKNQTEFTDERGNSEIYVHQKNGLLIKQIHADRSQVTSKWGAFGAADEYLMASMTDERGAVETFTYYTASDFKKGQLKTSTAKSYSPTTAIVTQYDYFQPPNRPHIAVLSTMIIDPGDPNAGYQNLKTSHSYDPEGRLTSTTLPDGHDAAGAVLPGRSTTRTYYVAADGGDAYRLGLLKSIRQTAILDPNDPNGVATVAHETTFDYDASGQVTTTTTSGATTLTSRYSNGQGMFQRTKDATNVVVDSIFDPLGRLRETGFGVQGTPAFDPIDQFTTKFKYDALGRVRESIDPLGRVTRFEYDRQGNVTKQINPDGTELLHEYDAFGNRIATTDALKRTIRFVYDNRNRLIQTILPGGAVERLRYDGAGNVVAKIDALGNATTFRYDAAGRLLETKLPDPDGPNDEDGDGINLTSPTTTNKYDRLGNLVETIDPEANVTQFKYDKLGRVVQTQTLKGVNGDRNATTPWVVTGTLQSLTTTDYDAVGNVIETAAYDVSLYDPGATATLLANPRAEQDLAPSKVQVVSIRYDAFGRPVKTTNADGTSTRIVYDAAGRVRYQYDEAGSATEFVYDTFGRLEKTKLPNPTTGTITTASPTTTYQYDAVGNRIAVTDARGYTTRFEYDVFNRLIAATDPIGGRSRSVYDVAGQLIATVDELGRATYSKFDERGQVILALSADPDGAGPKLPSATRSRYDDNGRLVEQTDPRGYATAYVYDRLGRLTIERSIESVVVDDFNGTNSSVFTFDGASQQNSWLNAAAIGGDTTTINGSAHSWQPYAQWAFPQMPAGNYRVAFTWAQTGNVSYASAGIAINSFSGPNAQARFYGGINQSQLPNDFYRDHAGSITAWEDVKFGNDQYYPISQAQASAGATILVNLIGTVGGTLQADAVRLERIVEKKFQYDANGNVTQSTDELGRVSDYQFDELDRPTIVQLPLPGNSGVNGAPLPRPKTTTAYDGYGNVKSVVEYRNFGVGGANQRKTAYEYDARNRRTAEILDAGVDGTNGVTDYVNQRTVYQYDAVGNLEYKREYAENAAAVDGYDLLRTTAYKYDKLGRLTRETLNSDGNDSSPLPTEQISLTTYDAAGNVQTRTETAEIAGGAAALTTTFVYDALNRVTSETAAGSSQSRRTRYQYDAIGNLTSEIDALGRLSRSEYDRLGRLVKSIAPDPDGKAAQLAESTSFAYDAVGKLVAQTNGAGETQRFAYDSHGLLIWSQDGRGDETIRRYDAVGNLVRLVDPAGNLTTYAYDGLDRLTTETTASGAVRTREYNALEQLAYATDRNGRATRYNYDRLDRKIEERWYADRTSAGNNQGLRDQLLWFYDDLGRLEEERQTRNTPAGAFDYRVTDSYVYDGLNRVVEHSNQSIQATNPLHSSSVPAIKQTHAYANDASGLIETREQLIAGQLAASTKLTYNAFGELVRREDKDLSATGVASAILDFESTDAVFSYLGDGSLASTARYTDWDGTPSASGYRNLVQTNYAYDGAGRLKTIAHSQSRRAAAANSWPTATPLVDFAYGYDAAGRIGSIETNWNTNLPAFSTRTDETQAYDFDDAGQLTTVNSNLSGQGATYAYGTNGNRSLSTEQGLAQYVYQADNRVSSDATYGYDYDLEGNLIQRTSLADANDYETYAWDHRNRLTKVERYVNAALADTVVYRYNASGDLVYRSVTPAGQSAQVEHYLVESGQRTLTFEADGDVKRRYQYGPTGEVLLDQVFDATGNPTLQGEQDLLVPLSDHQHSTRVVLAHAGDDSIYVRQSIDYASFGRVTATLGANGLADAGSSVTIFGHHGSIADAATGLQLKGERWYSPDLGRFVSEDPIQDGANWYMFAGNDPVNYADPSGLSMQGYPLSGGFSGNKPVASTIGSGNSGLGPALSPSIDTFLRGAVDQALKPTSSAPKPTALLPPTLNRSASPADALRPYQNASDASLRQQRVELEAKRFLDGAQNPKGNLFGLHDAANLTAVNEELERRSSNWLAPTPQQTGPSMSPISMERAELGALRYLSTKGVFAPGEADEFAHLQLKYMSGLEYFNAGVGVIGAFAGTPIKHNNSTVLASRVRSSSSTLSTTTAPVGQLKAAGLKDVHHPIQHASVRDLPGYSKNAAPGVHLPGPSTQPGTPHYRATMIQRESGGGTYAAERRIGYKALRYAGYTKAEATEIIQNVDAYFKGIGVGPATPTRIPGNRPGGQQ